jgi:hypothetical protein
VQHRGRLISEKTLVILQCSEAFENTKLSPWSAIAHLPGPRVRREIRETGMDPGQLQHPVRRSGQLGQHVPHQVRSKVYEDCTANPNAEIPRGTRNADKRVEGNYPDPS